MADWGEDLYGNVVTARRERALDFPTVRNLLSVTATEGVIDQATSGRRDISADDKSKYLVVAPGDVVYNTMRMWQGVSGYSSLSGIVSPAYTVLRPNEGSVDGRFLAHLMKLPASVNLYRRYSQGLVSDTWNLKFSALAALPLIVPPLEEQQRIAGILDTIDETIQATERVIAKLALTRDGVLRDQFSALLDCPMVSMDRLGVEVTVGIVVRPTQYYVSAGVPVLRSANVREAGLEMTNLVYMSREDHAVMSKTAVVPGDLVTVRTGYPGTTAVIPATVPEANCVDIIITRTGSVVDPEFLAAWINSDFGKGHVLARQGGLAQQHFNVSDLKALPVPITDRSAQRRMVKVSKRIDDRMKAEESSLSKLRTTRSGLAADLLSGRVRTVVA
jgi:type I restriction enzyme S subunit